MQTKLESYEIEINPIDCVEEILNTNNWAFDRVNDNELMLNVTGKACIYRLFFIWQEDMRALQFCCQYDLVIKKDNYSNASKTLMRLNENLWMGHFDIPYETGIPSFRHTCLLRGVEENDNAAHIEDLIDISMVQCEKHFQIFNMLTNFNFANDQDLSLALMSTSGEA